MRLNKYIAHCGVCSRRKADELIEQGAVTINGVTAHTGEDVKDGDVVAVSGRPIRPEKRLVYYLLNKPVGYITTVDDEQNRPTVMELLDDIPERVYPVGRLDFNTSGMLLLTNDGDLTQRLTHPKSHIVKTYIAEVAGLLTMGEAKRLERGVDIGGYITRPAQVEVLKQSESTSIAQIRISEGKNRQVRRMFEAVGHRVVKLERTAIGNMKMAHLRPGQYRNLSKNEIDYLKSL
ncbi:MAG: pseudouridine synthase [Anaerovoracaceae bacterium]